MSLATQRAAIKTKLEAVTGIGSVLDYVVWTDDWQFIYDHFTDTAQNRVHVWFIGLASSQPQSSLNRNIRVRQYTWNIIGYYSMKTAAQSSKTFEEVIDAILAKFDPIGSIGAGLTHQMPSLAAVQNTIFAQHGCHTAQVQLTVTEQTEAASPCA